MVVESVSAVATATSTTLTITKPTGVEVGDLLVAVLTSHDAEAGANDGTWSTLATWTSAIGALYGGNLFGMSIQYRVATSTDVSTSNYTFSHSQNETLRGYMLRCSGNNVVDGGLAVAEGYTNIDANSATYNDAITSYTPPVDGALVIMQIGLISSPTFGGSISAYTVPNVSFTEAYDNYFGDGTPAGLVASAYGIQSTASEITSNQATIINAWDEHYGQFVVFNPPVPATGTNTLVTTTSEALAQTGTCDTNGTNNLETTTSETFTQSGRGEAPQQWTEPTKSTDNWTNKNI